MHKTVLLENLCERCSKSILEITANNNGHSMVAGSKTKML